MHILEDNLSSSMLARDTYCKGRVWILRPQDNKIKAQRAQYKEFLENGLKTRFW